MRFFGERLTAVRVQTAKPWIDPLTEPPDPKESAQAAGLRYVTDAKPGIRRVRCGKGFRYTAPSGETIHDDWQHAALRALPRGHHQDLLKRFALHCPILAKNASGDTE